MAFCIVSVFTPNQVRLKTNRYTFLSGSWVNNIRRPKCNVEELIALLDRWIRKVECVQCLEPGRWCVGEWALAKVDSAIISTTSIARHTKSPTIRTSDVCECRICSSRRVTTGLPCAVFCKPHFSVIQVKCNANDVVCGIRAAISCACCIGVFVSINYVASECW